MNQIVKLSTRVESGIHDFYTLDPQRGSLYVPNSDHVCSDLKVPKISFDAAYQGAATCEG